MAKPLTYYIHLTPDTAEELTTMTTLNKLALAKALIEMAGDELNNPPLDRLHFQVKTKMTFN
jgi:hypothetical protein